MQLVSPIKEMRGVRHCRVPVFSAEAWSLSTAFSLLKRTLHLQKVLIAQHGVATCWCS